MPSQSIDSHAHLLAHLLTDSPGDDENRDDSTPVAILICNWSSVCFYIMQFCYASYMLYLLLQKNERSKSLILATIMIIYSSVSLGVFFGLADLEFIENDDWTANQKTYYVFCMELPFLFVFMAHWIIFYQYLELAVILPILVKLADNANEASNKITSVRQCLNATMIIVIAILVAHFVDHAFYTFKQSSTKADQNIAYFAMALKMALMFMIGYVFYKIRAVVKSEPLLKLKSSMWNLHIVCLFMYFLWWSLYEAAYTIWILDPNSEIDKNDAKLMVLAVVELLFNSFSVFLGALLFYMVDQMTRQVTDAYFDPLLKREVPFFVYFANLKLIQQHFTTGNQAQHRELMATLTSTLDQVSETRHHRSERSSRQIQQRLMNSTSPNASQAGVSIRSGRSRLSAGAQLIDRELARQETTYRQISDDPKWNKKTIKLAFQFMKLNLSYLPSTESMSQIVEGVEQTLSNSLSSTVQGRTKGRSESHQRGSASSDLSNDCSAMGSRTQSTSVKMNRWQRDEVISDIEQHQYSQLTIGVSESQATLSFS